MNSSTIGAMGSIGTGEIMVIVLVALIVFGPERLPEITRKAGALLAKARQMTQSFSDSMNAEYGEIASPIKDLKGEYDATMSGMKGMASSITDMTVELPTIDLKAVGSSDTAPKESEDVAADGPADEHETPEDPEPPAPSEEAQ